MSGWMLKVFYKNILNYGKLQRDHRHMRICKTVLCVTSVFCAYFIVYDVSQIVLDDTEYVNIYDQGTSNYESALQTKNVIKIHPSIQIA